VVVVAVAEGGGVRAIAAMVEEVGAEVGVEQGAGAEAGAEVHQEEEGDNERMKGIEEPDGRLRVSLRLAQNIQAKGQRMLSRRQNQTISTNSTNTKNGESLMQLESKNSCIIVILASSRATIIILGWLVLRLLSTARQC